MRESQEIDTMATKQTPRERRLARQAARRAAQTPAVERREHAVEQRDDTTVAPVAGVQVGPARLRVSDKVEIVMTPPLLSTLDAEAYTQLLQTSEQPGVTRVYLMPDGHTGYGCPVGTVAVARDWIYPMMAGYDIGCFTADTLVPTIDGQSYPIGELAAADQPILVYALDETHHIAIAQATA